MSAAATHVLLTGKARPRELLPLAYKELVLRGSLTVTGRPRRFGRPQPWLLVAAPVALPHELRRLDENVRRAAPAGGSISKVVEQVRRAWPGGADELRDETLHRLEADGLVTREKRLLRPARIHLTDTGVATREAFAGVRDVQEPAVLLLGDRSVLPEIDRALTDALGDVDVSVFTSSFDSACHDAGGHGGHDGGGGHH